MKATCNQESKPECCKGDIHVVLYSCILFTFSILCNDVSGLYSSVGF